jgi:hypothetical protein
VQEAIDKSWKTLKAMEEEETLMLANDKKLKK